MLYSAPLMVLRRIRRDNSFARKQIPSEFPAINYVSAIVASEKLITRWWLVTLLIFVYSEIYLRFAKHRRFSNRVNDSMAARSINCSLGNNWKRGERRGWPTAGVTAGKKARITGANFESSTIRLIANLRNGDASYTAMRAKSNQTWNHRNAPVSNLHYYDIEIWGKGNE